MKKWLVLLILGCCMNAQSQKLDFGIQLGGAFYDGDLSVPGYWNNATNLNGAFGVVARFQYFEGIILRAGGIYTRVTGDDSASDAEWQIDRNLQFRSSILEGNVILELHPLQWFNSTRHFRLSPYVFGGAAVFYYNPQGYIDGQWVDLQPLGTEGQGMQGYEGKYDLHSLALPFGLGVRYHFSDRFFIDIEYGARRTDTDYLDDISREYVSVGDLSEANGGLAARLGNKINAATGDKRGNPDVKDWYGVPMITLAYQFDLSGPGRIKMGPSGRRAMGCPKF